MRRVTLGFGVVIFSAVLMTVGSRASDGSYLGTIHIQEHATNATYVSVAALAGGTGPSTQGDYIAFDDPDFDPNKGEQVGHNMGVCTLVDVATQIYSCPEVTFFLTGRGQIVVGGEFDGTGNPTNGSILGGTGEFLGAHGTVRVQSLNGGSIDDFVFTLLK